MQGFDVQGDSEGLIIWANACGVHTDAQDRRYGIEEYGFVYACFTGGVHCAQVETMYSDYAVGHLTKQLPRSMFVDCIVECVFSICQDWEEADRKLEILVQML